MSITKEQLKFYKAEESSDAPTNGGRLSSNQVVQGVANNLFPDVSESERTNGVTRYRKMFCKVDSPENLDLKNPAVFVENYTPADDAVYLFPATQEDTQASITGSERLYGCGYLDAEATAGVTTISVVVEDAANGVIFVDGDVIRLSDKTDPSDAAGNADILTIVGTPSVAGNVVTVNLISGVLHTYSSGAGSRVASLYKPGDISTSASPVVAVSSSGTYDDTNNPIDVDDRGGIFERWTLTFTDPTTFTCVGDTLGDIQQNGSRSVEYAPINTDFSTPYFTIKVSGWGGTFASGDTIRFTTTPIVVPIWERLVVPAGASSLSGNSVSIGFSGESA